MQISSFRLGRILMTFLPTVLLLSCGKDSEPLISNEYTVVVSGGFEVVELDRIPVYRDGGDATLYSKVLSEISYPPEAREMGIEGAVVLQFEITEIGYVEAVVIIEDPGAGLGAEAKRAFDLFTEGLAFHPAIFNGAAVRVRTTFDVIFQL